jgi:hypothetical protein
LRWSVVLAEHPLKLEFHGRKSHRMTYFTFLGRDSIEHLKAWKATWKELGAREPGQDDLIFIGKRARPVDPNWLNSRCDRVIPNPVNKFPGLHYIRRRPR